MSEELKKIDQLYDWQIKAIKKSKEPDLVCSNCVGEEIKSAYDTCPGCGFYNIFK